MERLQNVDSLTCLTLKTKKNDLAR